MNSIFILNRDLLELMYDEKLNKIKANLVVLWNSQQSNLDFDKGSVLVISYKKMNNFFIDNGININKGRLKKDLINRGELSVFSYSYDKKIKSYFIRFGKDIFQFMENDNNIEVNIKDILKIPSKNILTFYLNILLDMNNQFLDKIYSRDEMLELFKFDKNAYRDKGIFLRKDFEKLCLKKAVNYINENLDLSITFERLSDINAYYKITAQKKENYYNNNKEIKDMKNLFGDESKIGKTGRHNIIMGITAQMRELNYSQKVIDVFIDYLLILFDTKHPFSLTTAERILSSLTELKKQGYLDEMLLEVIDNSRGKGWFSIYPLKDDVNRRMIIAGREAEKRSNLTDKDLLKEDNWLDRLENIK